MMAHRLFQKHSSLHARWLPAGKCAAVCLSVDDIHPASSHDGCEAGGDLGSGALGRLVELQRRHPQLQVTLCVTPNWRLDSLRPDLPLLRHIPWLKQHVHWARRHPADRFRIDRHPQFVAWINALSRCEVVPHGLTHSHAGERFAVEFQEQSEAQCAGLVQQSLDLFDAAKLKYVRGFVPPAWNAPPALIAALSTSDFHFLSSARDLRSDVHPRAKTAMSGLQGVSLIHPQFVGKARLVHVTSNFQATSPFARACEIVDHGGVLHIKAHVFKSGRGHTMLDGLDDLYVNYLDLLFMHLEQRYGNGLWWAKLSEIAQQYRDVA
jgi:Uncharacterized protein conserved in bacteria (DUF2334)